MEYIEGHTLRELGERTADVPSLIPIFRQIAEAMAAAHAGGIVHRDIKPANVMLRTDGYIKVLDFGLARLARTSPAEDETCTEFSQPGVVVGTAKYMSPEQGRDEAVESPSDVFSMAGVLRTRHGKASVPVGHVPLIFAANPDRDADICIEA